MTPLDAFCAREARRAAAYPTLAAALLAGGGFSYAAHRTRYLLARVPVRVSLHLVEVWLLASLFPMEEIGPIFGIRAAMSVAAALGWGALEPLRVDVRDLARRRGWSEAGRLVQAHVGRSVWLGFVQLALALASMTILPREYPSFSIFDAYAIAAGLRMLLETVARTYAAGIGALRRIPRPFWVGLPGDVVDLCGAILAWPFAGPWGFSVALLLGGVLRAGLTLRYARRAYLASPLRRLRVRAPLRSPALPRGTALRMARSAFANATAQLDAWLLLVLTVTASTPEDGLLVAAMHVLRPLLSASIGWTRLFYLDFKQLEVKGALLQRRFDRLLARIAVGLSVVTGLILLGLLPLLFEEGPTAGLLWLVPFLVARSLFALAQTRSFTMGRMRPLLRATVAVIVGLAATALVPLLREHALPSLVVVLTLGLAAGRAANEPRRVGPGVVGLYRWLALLARQPGPVRVCSGTIPARVSLPVRRVAAEVARVAGVDATTWGRRSVMWFEAAPVAAGVPPGARIALASAGCLGDLRFGTVADDGRAALRAALAERVVEHGLATRLEAALSASAEDVSARLIGERPGGTVLDAHRGRLEPEERRATLGAAPVRRALAELLRQSDGPGGRRVRSVPARLSVFCPRGEPELVFVLPRDVDAEAATRFRLRVEDATLAASLR